MIHTEHKPCYFCAQNIETIDYKNGDLLRKFISGHAKIMPPQRTGTCHRHQHKLARALKQARFLAIIPITTR